MLVASGVDSSPIVDGVFFWAFTLLCKFVHWVVLHSSSFGQRRHSSGVGLFLGNSDK